MRGFLAVFGREIAEHRLLFLTGLLGLFSFLLLFVVPGSRVETDQRGGVALLLSGIVGALLALGLGASVVARDVAERRLGFYFARPLSGWAIWAGKLGAALALCLGAGLLALLPALLFEPAVRAELANGGWLQLLYGAGGIATLVLLADVVSLMVRSRSPWLGLDLAAAGAVALLVWDAAARLMRAGMVSVMGGQPTAGLLQRALLGCAPVVLLALLAGSAAQVLGGRTDPRRGHRLLSTTLWGLLLAGALGLLGYSRWLVAATPADLVTVDYTVPARAGSAVVVQGRAAHRDSHYRPLFLIDAKSGRFERIFATPFWWGRNIVHVSADGRRAVWLEPQDLQGRAPAVLVRLDLTRSEARPIHTSLTFANSLSTTLVLSPDGRRLATTERGRLIVEDLETARLLASFAIAPPNDGRSRLQFLDGAHLRSFQTSFSGIPGNDSATERGARVEVTDFDLTTGRSEQVGRTQVFEATSVWEPSPDGSHLLVHQPTGKLDLFAARGETLVAELPARPFASRFLSDGRVVITSREAGRRELTVLSPEGVAERRFAFPDVAALRLGGEPLPGHLVIAVRTAPVASGSDRPELWESRLLDLATGESRSLGRGLLPAAGPDVGPASAGSRLFFRDGARLVLLDPASGRERTVTGRPSR